MNVDLFELKSALRKEIGISLPGSAAQFKMSPRIRRVPEVPESSKRAGVMILLYPDRDMIRLCLIKRAEYEGAHSGQISFPGGFHEGSDPDLQSTALRETAEETGVQAGHIETLGRLSPLIIPISGVKVYPFCGVLSYCPEFDPDPVEVQYILSVPLHEFFQESCIREEKWELGGVKALVPFYFYREHKIWGATAMMLSEFLEIILRSGLYQPVR